MPAKKPRLKENAIPAGWTDEQVKTLIDWLGRQVEVFGEGRRRCRAAHRIAPQLGHDANALYYKHAEGAVSYVMTKLFQSLLARQKHAEESTNADSGPT